MRKVIHEPGTDRIACAPKNNRNSRGRLLRRLRRQVSSGDYNLDLGRKLSGKARHAIRPTLRVTRLINDRLTFDVPQVAHGRPEYIFIVAPEEAQDAHP